MASKKVDVNEIQMQYYAAALCGIIAIYVLFHLMRVGARRFGIANKHVFAPFHSVSR
jgi:hypothetical protein